MRTFFSVKRRHGRASWTTGKSVAAPPSYSDDWVSKSTWTHLAPDWRNLRPPYHGLWKLKARADIEFPPAVAYRKVYVAQQKGRFYAVNARTH